MPGFAQNRRARRHRLLAICFAVPAAAILFMGVTVARTLLQADRNRDLIAAIERNDTKRALRLVADGADARSRKSLTPQRTFLQVVLDLIHPVKPASADEGESALALAVENNNTEVAASLLARGANQVNEMLSSVEPDMGVKAQPLLIAAMLRKNLPLVKLLLDHSADVHVADEGQDTCLAYMRVIIPEKYRYEGAPQHFQADSELALKMAHLLGEHGVNLHKPVSEHEYLLGWATENAQTKLSEYLVSQRVTPREAQSAVNGAVSTGSVSLVKRLIRLGAHLRPLDPTADTPMLSAEDPAMVDFLVSRGIDVNTPMKRSREAGRTCLQQACDRGNMPLVRCLVGHGADVNVFTNVNHSPLMDAASDGDIVLVDYLLAHGARVNAAAEDGRSALYFASRDGSASVVRRLLAHGADPNCSTEESETPLMAACRESKIESVRLLLSHGARVNLRDNEGRTAVDYARENGHFAIEVLLRQHGGRSGFPHH